MNGSSRKMNNENVVHILLKKEMIPGTILKALTLIHISEPTRPLYISYAAFCLKKKKKKKKEKKRKKRMEHSMFVREISVCREFITEVPEFSLGDPEALLVCFIILMN